jgi:hypothetical protein
MCIQIGLIVDEQSKQNQYIVQQYNTINSHRFDAAEGN